MSRKKTITISVTTDWAEVPVVIPSRITITRIRAIAGSPATQVAVSIREKAGTEDVSKIPLEYFLATSPLFSSENILVEAEVANENTTKGTMYVAAKADVSCQVTIQIEYT